MHERPHNEEELQKREAIGVIRASRFVRKYARTHKPISFATVCDIHKEIFKEAWPEIAGKFRDENLEITDSKHLPPHHSKVLELVEKADRELKEKLAALSHAEGDLIDMKNIEEGGDVIEQVVYAAAWLHHSITHIHPFREGNGRTARLAGNLILERYGLVGISIKIERENKNRYRATLAQIDQKGDYEPLVNLIYEGLLERYGGASLELPLTPHS